MNKIKLCGLTFDEIYSLIGKSGYTKLHALKVANSIYKKKVFKLSDLAGIPKNLKKELEHNYVTGTFAPSASEVSSDGTIKYLFINEEGKKFETVFIPESKRYTVCVSSQSGCRMGCPFCVTGQYGFHGNLTAAEIVNQVISLPVREKVTHVVFMGMGEPMDNLDNVLIACKILTSEWGLSISQRNITVSSVGITSGIEKFLASSNCNLTVSLFSPFFAERKKIVPVESGFPIEGIIDIMKSFPLKKKRRLSFSYVMIKNVNDTDEHLEELKKLLSRSELRINLLPYHSVSKDKNVSSPVERMNHFKHNLVISGISASIRKSRGSDISAACGLLASNL